MTGAPGPVITAWSAISPFGVGAKEFMAGVKQGRVTAARPGDGYGLVPDEPACLVPDFDVREALGPKGTRAMNRMTGLAVACTADVLAGLGAGRPAPERTALVLGTSTGSLQSAMAFTRGSLTAPKPYQVDAALIPYAVMNAAASQCAIWHELRGQNATIAAGRPTGLVALSYARRLLLTGRASAVLCGAAEEFSAARAWVDSHSREEPAVLGEGCVMFALTLASPGVGQVPLATVLAVDSRVCADGNWRGAVGACVGRVLAVGGRQAAEVGVAVPSGLAAEAGRAEQAALTEVFGSRVLAPVTELIGETHAVSAAFQVAAVLSRWSGDHSAGAPLAVVTSADPGGQVAAALLRREPA